MSPSTICRLCVHPCNDFKSLYYANGRPNGIYEITLGYFHPQFVDMEAAKHLTDICRECFRHIYEFHSFQTSVMIAQLDLMEDGQKLAMQNFQSVEGARFSVKVTQGNEKEFLDISEEEQEEGSQENLVASTLRFSLVGDEHDFILQPKQKIGDVHTNADLEGPGPTGTGDNSAESANDESGTQSDLECIADKQTALETRDTIQTKPDSRDNSSDNNSSAGDSDYKEPGNRFENTQTLTKAFPEQVSRDSENANYFSADEGDPNKKFECKLCLNSNVDAKGLERHLRQQHPGVKPDPFDTTFKATARRFKCQLCDNSFPHKDNLTLHMRLQHANRGDGYIKCKVCGNSFRSLTALRLHLKKQHPAIQLYTLSSDYEVVTNSFKCKFCGKLFSRRMYLVSHIQQQHHRTEGHTDHLLEYDNPENPSPEDKEALKDVSMKITTKPKRESLEQQADIDVNFKGTTCRPAKKISKLPTKKFKCKLCGTFCGTLISLRGHLRQQHPGVLSSMLSSDYKATTNCYKCTICTKLFSLKSSLISHMQDQHGERNGLPSDGDDKDSLKNVLATLPQFKCDFCGCSYDHQINLKKHMRLHGSTETANKLRCMLCHKTFQLKSSLKKHLIRQHWTRCEFDNDDERKILKCLLCENSYKTWSLVIAHLAQDHAKFHRANCDCEKCKPKKDLIPRKR